MKTPGKELSVVGVNVNDIGLERLLKNTKGSNVGFPDASV